MRSYQTKRQIDARKERRREYLDYASLLVSIAAWIAVWWMHA